MTDLPGWQHAYSGKVRDLYTSPSQPERMLVVASDRVSAFDHVLEPGIPGKGALLTKLSLWWFGQLDGVPNHLVGGETLRHAQGVTSASSVQRSTSSTSGVPLPELVEGRLPPEVADRAMLVKQLDMFPIECVVRGYLSGSGWKEYQATQSVCGVALPAGLVDGDRLPEPIYTPAWKAPPGEHDENITFERTVDLVGATVGERLRTLSLQIFGRASAIAESRGVILADTKFEFGADAGGTITLADEVLTSDSSRYWDAESYASGDRTASFDKQIVRNWLLENWEPSTSFPAARTPDAGASPVTGSVGPETDSPPPTLPDEIVTRTAARYRELIERLTA